VTGATSWLARIVEARRASVAAARAARGGAPLPERAVPVRDFEDALRSPGRRFIAEIKRRSPSAGAIRDPLDPTAVAASYARAGAAALSVLTEPAFFGGSEEDLALARAGCALAVLRKDFVLDREMVFESRAMGADAVLLIAALQPPSELRALVSAAAEAGLAALVEVHDEREMDGALASGARIFGVNSRDLRDFSVDLARAERLAARMPAGVVRVAESGIRSRADVERLEAAGFSSFLVGESLLRSDDPGARLAELLS
jgi:indole-3-glycerol phosphate synthase